jgi:uncharacterized OB-fold protein
MVQLKFTLARIFRDNLDKYKERYKDQMTNRMIAQSEKMIECGEETGKVRTYKCPECGETKKVPIRCRTVLCTHCGKRHADEWALKMERDMLEVQHRHMVFTIPAAMRDIFAANRLLWVILVDSAVEALKKVMTRGGWRNLEPGIIAILHPSGKDLKFNPHVHILVTEGGLDKATMSKWMAVTFFPYEPLRKAWQYTLLKNLRKELKGLSQWSVVEPMFEKYANGFYVRAKDRIWNQKQINKYVVRYVRHPAIAESRIVDYDGDKVTFYYEDEFDEKHYVTMPVLEFMHQLLQLIPDEGFKMIRHYGLYARNKRRKVRKIMAKLKKFNLRKEKAIQDMLDKVWRITCDKCGSVMYPINDLYPP